MDVNATRRENDLSVLIHVSAKLSLLAVVALRAMVSAAAVDTDPPAGAFSKLLTNEASKCSDLIPEAKKAEVTKTVTELRVCVRQKPNSDKGFGFTLKGGRDQKEPIIVASLVLGSCSERADVKVGDEILEINGTSTSGKYLANVNTTIREALHVGYVEMKLRRKARRNSSTRTDSDTTDTGKQNGAAPMNDVNEFDHKRAIFTHRPKPDAFQDFQKARKAPHEWRWKTTPRDRSAPSPVREINNNEEYKLDRNHKPGLIENFVPEVERSASNIGYRVSSLQPGRPVGSLNNFVPECDRSSSNGGTTSAYSSEKSFDSFRDEGVISPRPIRNFDLGPITNSIKMPATSQHATLPSVSRPNLVQSSTQIKSGESMAASPAEKQSTATERQQPINGERQQPINGERQQPINGEMHQQSNGDKHQLVNGERAEANNTIFSSSVIKQKAIVSPVRNRSRTRSPHRQQTEPLPVPAPKPSSSFPPLPAKPRAPAVPDPVTVDRLAAPRSGDEMADASLDHVVASSANQRSHDIAPTNHQRSSPVPDRSSDRFTGNASTSSPKPVAKQSQQHQQNTTTTTYLIKNVKESPPKTTEICWSQMPLPQLRTEQKQIAETFPNLPGMLDEHDINALRYVDLQRRESELNNTRVTTNGHHYDSSFASDLSGTGSSQISSVSVNGARYEAPPPPNNFLSKSSVPSASPKAHWLPEQAAGYAGLRQQLSAERSTRSQPTYQQPKQAEQEQTRNGDTVVSVSGRQLCSHCNDELGRGAAMIIESLSLYYHLSCFRCYVCDVMLGSGTAGTDVRVRSGKLHCQLCYSDDQAQLSEV